MRGTDDEFLAAAFRAGEEGAFNRVWALYAAQASQFVRKHVRDTDDVAEVLQEVRIGLAASRMRYNVGIALGAWTYGICRHCCFKWMHARQKRLVSQGVFAEEIECLVPLESEAKAEATARDADWDRLDSTLLILTARQRDIVHRRIVDEQSIAQVSADLHCAPGTVKATTHTALRRIREYLERPGNGHP